MTAAEIIQSQVTDIFRAGLIVALVITTLRTRAATGLVVPLAAGLVFVAVIIPTTMGGLPGIEMSRQVLLGLVANLVILVPVTAMALAITRRRP